MSARRGRELGHTLNAIKILQNPFLKWFSELKFKNWYLSLRAFITAKIGPKWA